MDQTLASSATAARCCWITTASIRFVPDPDYNGPSGDITFRAWDRTDANPSGTTGIECLDQRRRDAYSSETDTGQPRSIAGQRFADRGGNTGTTVLEGSTGTTITTAMLSEGDVDDSGAGADLHHHRCDRQRDDFLAGFGMGLGNTFSQADIDAGNVTYDHNDSETPHAIPGRLRRVGARQHVHSGRHRCGQCDLRPQRQRNGGERGRALNLRPWRSTPARRYWRDRRAIRSPPRCSTKATSTIVAPD